MQNHTISNIDYSNKNTLKNYAIWYYKSFSPSINKLKSKLKEKNSNDEIINWIITEISDILNEEYILSLKINTFLEKWKDDKYILFNLKKKLFKENEILNAIDKLKSENTYSCDYLKNKIISSKAKKSIKSIKINLLKSWYSKTQIDEIIENSNIYDEADDIRKHIDKYNLKWLDKKSIINKLLQKWYFYKDFKDLL